MKKSIYYIGLCFAGALALTACIKEVEPEIVQEEITHVATVSITKAIDTRTAVVEGETSASYIWTEGDDAYLNIYECYTTIDSDGKEVKNHNKGTITSIEYSADYKTATLTVSFSGNPVGPYSYEAIYAKSVSSNHNPSIQSTQYPKADSFDPAADVMISKATPAITGVSERLTSFSFTMGRVVTVNKMTLTDLTAGEKVKSVEFSLDKHMTGTYTIGTGNYSSGGKKLTFDYTQNGTTDGQVVPNGGNFPVYFISAPVDAAAIESVIVTTDQHVYNKSNTTDSNPFEGKSITFAIGTMKRFTMAMAGYGAPISTAVNYTKVSAAADLPAIADIIIVNGTNAMASQATNNRNKATVPAAVDNVISLDNSSQAHVFVLTKTSNGYLIQDKADNYYLYDAGTSKDNHLRSTEAITDACYWNLSYTDGALEVKSVNNTVKPYLRYNSNSNCFSCYGSGQEAVSIFMNLASVKDFVATPTITAVANGNSITVSWNDVDHASSYLVTCTGQSTQTINAGVGSATFENLTDGIYEVTVTAKTTDASYVDSVPAVASNIQIGTPTLTVPTNVTVSQTTTGISASWDAVEHADSYTWTLYDDASLTNVVATASVTTNSLTADITALTSGTTYFFVVIAKANGYTPSETSSPVSFLAVVLKSVLIDYTAQSYTNGQQVTTLNVAPINTTLAKNTGSNPPAYYTANPAAVRMYSGNTLTISSSRNIVEIEFSVSGSYNSITTETGDYTGTTWTGKANTIVFTCGSSQTRIQKISVTYEDAAGPEQLVMSTVSCTNSGENENSLTYSWNAVANASGYQVSTDGSSFGATQSELTFTLDDLEPGTSHSIWVKAIGDGTNYLTSDAIQSATGTTKGGSQHGTVTINAGALTDGVLSSNGFTLTFNKNTGGTEPTYNVNGEDIRLYAKGTVLVDGNDKTITSIVFKRLAPITASTGTIATQAVGDETVSWSGSAKKVTFTVGDNANYGSEGSSKAGQLDFSSVTITY